MSTVIGSRIAIAVSAVGSLALLVALGATGTYAGTSPPKCFDRPATIQSNAEFVPGTPGRDVIVTGNADNGVVADSGNDRVCTRSGDDFVRGDLGDDRINVGPGADKVSGGDLNPNNPNSGDDLIKGHWGPDELNGHDGNDVLEGGRGRDLLRGGPGRDVLNGGPNDDTCNGGPGRDTLINC
jgi:Ca2+-binding RTX toxin-like protein